MIGIEQCRAGRALVGWTQQDLAVAAGLSKTAVNNFEKAHADIKAQSLRAIQAALEGRGVEFLACGGLRLATERAAVLRGAGIADMILKIAGSDDILRLWGGEAVSGDAAVAAALEALPVGRTRRLPALRAQRPALIAEREVVLFAWPPSGAAVHVASADFAAAEARHFDLAAQAHGGGGSRDVSRETLPGRAASA
jgi:transcriptional regulator with XRE-family HTH domain